jgi:hypothetical protein
MMPEPDFHPEGVRRLACAVITQAAREALGRSQPTPAYRDEGLTKEILQERALYFLRCATGGEAEWCWFYLAGVDPEIFLRAVLYTK